MPVITSIKLQKKKAWVNLFLDGKFAFSLPAEKVVELGLKENQELSAEQIRNLIKENEFALVFDRVLHFLSFRPRSEKEVLDYLRKKGIGEETQKLVINKLKKLEFLNDKQFASWLLEKRSFDQPRGKHQLKTELLRKGIDKEIVDYLLTQRTEKQELTLAQKLIMKKLPRLANLPPEEKRKKLYSFLINRGFEWEIVKEAVDKLLEK